jgi:outer membrane protein OmpA-like peptidoglycan-associated protein/flagellar hook assembly protein FlgD
MKMIKSNNRKLWNRSSCGSWLITFTLFYAAAFTVFALPKTPDFGADTVQDLFSPDLAGQGTFVTSRGSAPFSAVNPAQAGQTDRMILNFGALGITDLNIADELGGIFDLGLLYPTKSVAFSGTLRYYYFDQFKTDFPLKNELGGNFSVAKEFFPQFSLGAGINFGAGPDNWTLSADLGLLHNLGDLGFIKNFTWAFVLRNMGMSWAPTWFTPWAGLTFDFLQIAGKGGKPNPLVLNFAADIGVPSVIVPENINVIIKTGITATVLEKFTLSILWPGAAGYNMREAKNENKGHFQWLPSVGVGINFLIPSGDRRQSGERRPSDGDITFDAAFKPLYYDVYATGAGVTWYAGYRDDLPPNIIVDYPETQYISPNYDGKADSLIFPVRIIDDHYVMSWVMTIKDSNSKIVRTYRNKDRRFEMMDVKDIYGRYYLEKKGVEVPSNMRWDGVFDTGEIGPDGKYFFSISATDENGNVGTSPIYEVILKNKAPQVAIDNINLNDRIFDPSGGTRTSINIVPRGSEEDKWESGIYDSEDKLIRTFAPKSGSPQPQVWDGKTDSGELAPDGAYTFKIAATDRAQNTGSAVMSNIVVGTKAADAILTVSTDAISPKTTSQTAELVRFNDRLNRTDAIDLWKLEIKNDKGGIVKIYQGSGGRPPENFSWDGLSDNGSIPEGLVYPELTVNYRDGFVANAKSAPILVDTTGPILDLSSRPEQFSPDNDGVNDVLSIRLKAEDSSPIARWTLDIYEPAMENGTNPGIFKHFEGNSAPVEELMWNGRGNNGDLVQSVVDYPYIFTVTDALGNTSVKNGFFGIDVLVIREEGDKFRIQIPSIVFPADSAVFDGLNQNTLDNNIRVIKRVAQILNKFRNYKVTIEGHANPTTAPGPSREQEEPSLKALSEKRAGYILEQLVRNSVARNRLSFTGAGGSMPLASFEDRSGWWKNRRVDFILSK